MGTLKFLGIWLTGAAIGLAIIASAPSAAGTVVGGGIMIGALWLGTQFAD